MRMVSFLRLLLLSLFCIGGVLSVQAQVPTFINYQGRIVVDGVNFSGDGQFKFAFVNADGSATYWSHDNTSSAGSEPSTHLVLAVNSGLYSVLLGDQTVKGSGGAAMKGIGATELNHSAVYLRIWVKVGTSGFQKLAPDQRIAAVAYALMADSVRDGSITSAKLASGSVTTDKLSVATSDLVGAGSITTSMLANGSVTADKLASSVNISIGDGSITTDLIADSAVTAAKLSVATSDIVSPGSITTAMLAPGAVTTDKLSGSVGGSNLLASVSPNDAALLAGGFIRVHSIPAQDWQNSLVGGGPNGRSLHSGVWTGSEMIVWGGKVGSSLSNQGGVYNPDTSNWGLLPISDASPGRDLHTTIWTGERMIVWGGYLESGLTPSGAIFAPANLDANPPEGGWLATSLTSAPVARSGHTAVWTGTKMLVWGGRGTGGALNDGAAFTPPSGPLVPGAQGTWSTVSTGSAPAARSGHSAIWTGTKMLVWGGLDASFGPLGSGGIYDPATNTWTAISNTGAPSARTGHSAVWTGSKMIIFGGTNAEIPGSQSNLLSDGAVYDVASGTWAPLSASGAPTGRLGHNAVWTGAEMLIIGGEGVGGQTVKSGAAYNVTSGSWRILATDEATSLGQTSVWADGEVLGFGSSGLRTLDTTPAVYFYARF